MTSDLWPPTPPRRSKVDNAKIADGKVDDEFDEFDNDIVYEVAPPHADSPESVLARIRAKEHEGDLPEAEPALNLQQGFTLKQLLLMMVAVSVALAIGRLVPPAAGAGIAGVAVLFGLAILSVTEPPAIVRLSWWAMLGLYLMLAALAVVKG